MLTHLRSRVPAARQPPRQQAVSAPPLAQPSQQSGSDSLLDYPDPQPLLQVEIYVEDGGDVYFDDDGTTRWSEGQWLPAQVISNALMLSKCARYASPRMHEL